MTSAIKNSFWYLFFNLSRLVVLFLGTMWISRVLGPESFGQFSYLLSVIVFVSAIDSLCHESIVKQYLTQHQDAGLIMGTASLLNLILAAIAVLFILIFGFLTIPESLLLATFFLFIPGQLSKPINPVANLFDIRLLSKYSSLGLFVGALISIVFRVGGVSFSHDLWFQSLGYSMQTLVYAGVLYLLYRKKLEHLEWKVSLQLLREMVKKSSPIFLSALVYLSISQSDIFFIRHMLGAHEVGIYSVVVKLSEPWVIVSSALCTSYFPLIFRSAHNLKKQADYFIRANQISVYFVSILGLVLSLAIEFIVRLLLGPAYSEVSSIFRIYYWSIIFLFFANIQHIWEVYNGLYSVSLYKTIVTCILKIALSFILGRLYGLQGFALATVISLFFYGVGFNFFNATTRPYLALQTRAFTLSEAKKNYRLFRQRAKKWLKKEY
ncbi:MAG: flippase [Bdellovibrio sp.]|nr:flippase [Bdellovibrio sp.]